MQARCWERGRPLKCGCGKKFRALVEEAVAPHAISAEAGHSVGNLEGRPTVDPGSLHPRGLAWWIVGHLVLKEDVRSAVPIPDHLVLLVVLDKKPVSGHVVAVHDHAGVGSVAGPTHTIT